jgi:hypothetical protein
MPGLQRVMRGLNHIASVVPRALVVLTLVATWTSYSFAQNASNMINLFDGLMLQAMREAANAEWRKVSRPESACIERELQTHGRSIAALAQQGVFPNDGRIASSRSDVPGRQRRPQFRQ